MKISNKKLYTVIFVLFISFMIPNNCMGQKEKENIEAFQGDRTEKDSRPKDYFAYPELEKAIDPDKYILGPYDRLVVSLLGTKQREYDVVVLPEGSVFLPGMGEVHAAGLTLGDFRKRLSKRINVYFHNVEFFCYLKIPRSFRVFVTGEVANPGAVSVSAIQRVSDAINEAGGLSKDGSECNVILSRDGKKERVDLRRFRLNGNFDHNPFLRSGDRIHVPPGGMQVKIMGEVKREGYYCMVPGETIGDLIELAGGFTTEAVTDSVMLSRIEKSGPIASINVLSNRFDMELKNLDEVSVYDQVKGSARVFVLGEFSGRGRYYITPGEKLESLIRRIGRFEDLSNLDMATLDRKNGEVIEIDIRSILSDQSKPGIRLENGDVLSIGRIFEGVLVGGEVQEPGEFPYMGDWTVARYVGMAGGPTERGSVDRVDIFSPDGKKKSAGRDYRPQRGDVIIVKKSKSHILGNVVDGIIRLGTVVITIIVLTD
jgi:protein involved in polysaccharide export with SLBB domain